ncbi:MAG: OB-fold protein [Telluria sp.]
MTTFIVLVSMVIAWITAAMAMRSRGMGSVRSNLMGFCAMFFAGGVCLIIFGERPKEEVSPPIVTTAHLLWQEYADNEVAAEQKFRGKLVKVGGIVQRIGDEDGDLAVMLEGAEERTTVIAFLDWQQERAAATIRRGDAVALVCGGAKMVNGNPALRGCHIVG